MDEDDYMLMSDQQLSLFQNLKKMEIQEKDRKKASNRIRRQQTALDDEKKTLFLPKPKVFQQKVSMCYVDSRLRDLKEYPEANNFRVYLGRTYTNVKEIALVSTEFPNSDAVIKTSSNTIYWINEEDKDLNFPVYSVQLKTGYYTSSQLATELEEKLRTVKRRNGLYHYFIVGIDTNSDLVSFISLKLTAIGNAPISTIRGTNILTINHPGHGFGSGDEIYIIGASSIAGIPSTIINNTKYAVTVLNANEYQIEVNVIATDTLTGGGNVKIGVESPFKFLFGEFHNNPSKKLGFPLENSSQYVDTLVIKGPLRSKVLPLDNLVQLTQTSFMVQSISHGLKINDKIMLFGVVTVPSVASIEFTIISVLDTDSFVVVSGTSIDTLDYSSISQATIRTNIFYLTFGYPHGFNRIIEISNYDPSRLLVYTLFDHGLTQGQEIHIYPPQGSTLPITSGPYVIDIVSPDSFLIENITVLTESITNAYIDVATSFYLYNVDKFDAYDDLEVSKFKLFIREIESDRQISFAVDKTFMSVEEEFGGTEVRISSSIHGFRGKQTNRDAGLFKSIDLSGENYVYFVSEKLGGTTFTNHSGIGNIFAKLQLSASPGAVIFNSFISTPIVFETPETNLTYFDMSVLTVDKELYDFNKLDFSFSLRVTELIEPLEQVKN